MSDTPLTDQEITEVLAVCERATPGLWNYDAAEIRSRNGVIVVDADDGVQ